jgi:Ca2+-binding RTX toxin-like protein
MNMISTGAFLNEMDASNKQPTVAEKFAAVWEKKNAKAARAGGVSLMALSLAACGSSSTTTTSSSTTSTTTTTATAQNKVFTSEIDALVGGSGADTFTGDTNTVSAADSVDGGAGTDTMKLYGTTGEMTHSNVEVISLYNYGGAFDVSDDSAVTTLNLDNATTAQTFTIATGQTVSVADMANGEVVDFAGNTVVTLDATVNGLGTVAGAGVTIDTNSTAQTTLDLTGATAASHVVLANTGAKLVTVNVKGDQAMKVDANTGNIALTTLSGSTATGALEFVIDTNTNKDIAVTGGSAGDLITMAGTLAKGDTVDGGAGDDILSITQASMTVVNAYSAADKATMNANISNIETLRVTDAVTASFDVERYDSIQNLDLKSVSGAITISNVASGGNITVRDAPNATTDSIVVPVKNATVAGNNSDSLTLTLNDAAAAGAVNLGVLNVVGLETLNIATASTTLAGAAGTTTSYELDIANTSTSLNTLTITGTEGIDLDGVALTNTIETIDASGLTVGAKTDVGIKVAVAGSGTQGVVITGTGGVDTVTGGAVSDSVTLGAGADVYTATAGNDIVDLGADDDGVSISKTLLAANSGTTATLDGGTGNDTITITGTGATIVDADFRGITNTEYLVTGNGANSITLDTLADAAGIVKVTGGTGDDTIDLSGGGAGAFNNATTIKGGTGDDIITAGAGVDTFDTASAGDSTIVSAEDDASNTGNSIGANAIADGDTLTFGNGVDRIISFDADDLIDVATAATAPTNGVGVAANTDLTTGTTYVLYGNYNSGTKVFTVKANFAAAGGNNVADALVVEGDSGTLTFLTTTGYTVLEDLTAALTASNFV